MTDRAQIQLIVAVMLFTSFTLFRVIAHHMGTPTATAAAIIVGGGYSLLKRRTYGGAG